MVGILLPFLFLSLKSGGRESGGSNGEKYELRCASSKVLKL